MATKKYVIGFLTLLVALATITIIFEDSVKIEVKKTLTNLYVNESGGWTLTGTEYNLIYNGTKKLTPSSYVLNTTIDGSKITIKRWVYYTQNSAVVDTYEFDGTVSDKRLVPISHKVEFFNLEGYKYTYQVKNLYYDGITQNINVNSYDFGKQTKVEWDSGYTSAKLTKKPLGRGWLDVKYDIDSSYKLVNVRLFDPPSLASLDTYIVAYYPQLNRNSGSLTNISDYMGESNLTVVGTMTRTNHSWGGREWNFTNSSGGDRSSYLYTPYNSEWSYNRSYTLGCFVYLTNNDTTQQIFARYNTTSNNRMHGVTLATSPASGFQSSRGGGTTGNTTNSLANVIVANRTFFYLETWNKSVNGGAPSIYVDGSDVTAASPGTWNGDLFANQEAIWFMDYQSATTREFLVGGGLSECFVLNFDMSSSQVSELNTSYLAQGQTIVDWLDDEFNLSSDIRYVNSTHPSCSNSYTEDEVADPDTPWCSLSTSLTGITTSGLKVIVDGIHNDTDSFDWGASNRYSSETIWECTDSAKIQGFNIDLSITGDNDWVQQRNLTNNYTIWRTTSYGASSSTVMAGAYANGTGLLRFEANNEITNVTSLYLGEGYFFNHTGDDAILLRLRNGTNANSYGFKFGARENVRMSGAANVTMQNCFVDGGTDLFYAFGKTTHGIHWINNTAVNGKSDKGMFVFNAVGEDNWQIGNNMSGNRPSGASWYSQKNTGNDGNEYSCSWNQNVSRGFRMENNICTNSFNGLFLNGLVGSDYAKDASIQNNIVSNIYDDCVEIEIYGDNWTIRNNTATDCYVAFSATPFQSNRSRTTITYNVFKSGKQIVESDLTPSTTGVTVKTYLNSSLVNINFSHNTLAGRECFNSRVGGSEVYWRSYRNVSFYDNLCYSESGNNPIQVSGLYNDTVMWDYNSFWEVGDTSIATFYDGSSTSARTLAQMQSQQVNWNQNSLNVDPEFVDYNNHDLTPNSSSPVCDAASDGTDIGALSCQNSNHFLSNKATILDYLQNVSDLGKTLSGHWVQYNSTAQVGSADMTNAELASGEEFAIVAGDYYNLTNSSAYYGAINNYFIQEWARNRLVVLSLHMRNPENNQSVRNTTINNFTAIYTSGTNANQNFNGELDVIVDGLNILKANGVVVILDLYHEMDGTWFWYANKTPQQFSALWNYTQDYFITAGLNDTLIYLYADNRGYQNPSYYFPGSRTDLVGVDFYGTSYLNAWTEYSSYVNLNKTFGFAEFSHIEGSGTPSPVGYNQTLTLTALTNNVSGTAFLINYLGRWSINNSNNASYYLQSDQIITLDEMQNISFYSRDSYFVNDGFDNANVNTSQGWNGNESCVNNHSFIINQDYAREGNYALRTQLLSGDCSVASGNRSEIKTVPIEANAAYWYGFSIYVPAENTYPVTANNSNWNIPVQWHDYPDFDIGEPYVSPSHAFEIINNTWYISIRNDSRRNTTSSPAVSNYTSLGFVNRNQWTDWVVYINASYGKDGITTIWRNGYLVFNRTGGNAYNDSIGTYFKAGIYRGPHASENQTYYHDSFRIINRTGSYDDVSPQGNNPLILYINNTNTACSDSYVRAQAADPTTPWCLPSSTTAAKVEGGDVVYIANSNYNSRLAFANVQFNGTVKIIGQNRDTVLLNNIDIDFNKTNNGCWRNASSSSAFNVWASNCSLPIDEYATAYWSNGTGFFTTKNLSWFNSTQNQYDYSIYSDDTNNIMYMKSNFTAFNPNNYSLNIMGSNYDIISLDRINGTIEIYNLTLRFFKWGIYVRNVSQVTIDNVSFQFGTNGLRPKDGNQTNITVRNSYFNSWFDKRWYWMDLHKPEEIYSETKAISSANTFGSLRFYNNTITNWSNAFTITHGTTRQSSVDNLISQNALYNIFDDAIEIENRVSNWTIRDNYGTDVYVTVSFAPAECTGTCLFTRNYIKSNRTIRWNTTASDSPGYAFKSEGQSGQYMSGWNVTHNTFYSQGPGLNGISLGSINNSRFVDNIFYSINGTFVIGTSGYARNNTFYDYNLYYKSTGATPLFNRWNNDTGNQNTLAAALASAYWDGTWDQNSIEADPLFISTLGNNFTPYTNSPVCGAASDGGDIGAFTCSSLSSTTNSTILDGTYYEYDTSLNYTLNFTGVDNITITADKADINVTITNLSSKNSTNGVILLESIFTTFIGNSTNTTQTINNSNTISWNYPSWYYLYNLTFNLSLTNGNNINNVRMLINHGIVNKTLFGVLKTTGTDTRLETNNFTSGSSASTNFITGTDLKYFYIRIPTTTLRNLTLNITGSNSNPVGVDSTLYTFLNGTGFTQTGSVPFVIDDLRTNRLFWNKTGTFWINEYNLTNGFYELRDNGTNSCSGNECSILAKEGYASNEQININNYDVIGFNYSCEVYTYAYGFTSGNREVFSNCHVYFGTSKDGTGTNTLIQNQSCYNFNSGTGSGSCTQNYYNNTWIIRSSPNSTTWNVTRGTYPGVYEKQITLSSSTQYLLLYGYIYGRKYGSGGAGSGYIETTNNLKFNELYMGGFGGTQNNSAGYGNNFTVTSPTILSASQNISGVVLEVNTYNPGNSATFYYWVSANGGTNWESTSNGSFYQFNISGTDLKFRINATNSNISQPFGVTRVRILVLSTSPANVTIDLGGDDLIEYNISGTFNTSKYILLNDTQSSVRDYISNNCIDDDNCTIPVLVRSSSAGSLLFVNLTTQSTVNPIFINGINGTTRGNLTFSSPSNANFTVSAWQLRFKGDLDNINMTATLKYANGSTNVTQFPLFHVRYSPFNVSSVVPYLDFYPTARTSYNVSPYKQTTTNSYWNLTPVSSNHTTKLYAKLYWNLPNCMQLWSSNASATGLVNTTTTSTHLLTLDHTTTGRVWHYLDYLGCSRGSEVNVVFSAICTECVQSYDFDRYYDEITE